MKVSLEKVVWTGSKSSGGELTNKQTSTTITLRLSFRDNYYCCFEMSAYKVEYLTREVRSSHQKDKIDRLFSSEMQQSDRQCKEKWQ